MRALADVARSGPRVDAADVGSFWLGEDGHVWQIVGYCEHPTVTFARVDDPTQRRGGAVGCPNTAGFRRLVEQEASS